MAKPPQPNRATLSACIITRNEASDLPRCLDSLTGLVDQIVVLDSMSTDETCAIATAAGAEVYHQPFAGYVRQKNAAFERARCDWILGLDADEWLDDELRESIAELLRADDSTVDGWWVKRQPFYLGRWMRHGGWSAEWKLRLVRRGSGSWTGVDPHDRLETSGRSIRLRGRLLHHPYRDLSEQIRKIDRYTTIQTRSDQVGTARALFGILLEPPLVFVHKFLVQGGILDGVRGFIAASSTAFYFFSRYAKQWERRHGRDQPDGESD